MKPVISSLPDLSNNAWETVTEPETHDGKIAIEVDQEIVESDIGQQRLVPVQGLTSSAEC